jgi:hypothetical protein
MSVNYFSSFHLSLPSTHAKQKIENSICMQISSISKTKRKKQRPIEVEASFQKMRIDSAIHSSNTEHLGLKNSNQKNQNSFSNHQTTAKKNLTDVVCVQQNLSIVELKHLIQHVEVGARLVERHQVEDLREVHRVRAAIDLDVAGDKDQNALAGGLGVHGQHSVLNGLEVNAVDQVLDDRLGALQLGIDEGHHRVRLVDASDARAIGVEGLVVERAKLLSNVVEVHDSCDKNETDKNASIIRGLWRQKAVNGRIPFKRFEINRHFVRAKSFSIDSGVSLAPGYLTNQSNLAHSAGSELVLKQEMIHIFILFRQNYQQRLE